MPEVRAILEVYVSLVFRCRRTKRCRWLNALLILCETVVGGIVMRWSHSSASVVSPGGTAHLQCVSATRLPAHVALHTADEEPQITAGLGYRHHECSMI